MSCPRLDANNLIVDECQGETLECDVKMRLNSRSVSCTNGTLISNSPIVCKSATLLERKNVLNCQYKTGQPPTFQEVVPLHPELPKYSPNPSTTARPDIAHQPSLLPPPVIGNGADGVDTRGGSAIESLGLLGEVQHAMKAVFPHELLSLTESKDYLPPAVPESNMYLPPKPASAARIPDDLKHQLKGVFPHNLFAMSQTNDEILSTVDDNVSGLSDSREQITSNQNQLSLTENRRAEWDINAGRKTVNPGTSTKNKPAVTQSRFSVTQGEDFTDRLIFTA